MYGGQSGEVIELGNRNGKHDGNGNNTHLLLGPRLSVRRALGDAGVPLHLPLGA